MLYCQGELARLHFFHSFFIPGDICKDIKEFLYWLTGYTAFFQVHFVFFLAKLYRKSLKHSNFYVVIWTILNRHITRHKRKFPVICTNMNLYSQRQIKNILDKINILYWFLFLYLVIFART